MITFGSQQLPEAVAPAWLVLTNANEDLTSLAIVEGDFLGTFSADTPEARRARIARATHELCGLGLACLYDLTSGAPDSDSELEKLLIAPAAVAATIEQRPDWSTLAVWRTQGGHDIWLSGPTALMRESEANAV